MHKDKSEKKYIKQTKNKNKIDLPDPSITRLHKNSYTYFLIFIMLFTSANLILEYMFHG